MVFADGTEEEVVRDSKLKKNLNLELELTGALTIFNVLGGADCSKLGGDSVESVPMRKAGEVVVGTYISKNLRNLEDRDVKIFIKQIYNADGAFVREYLSREGNLTNNELKTIGSWLGVRACGYEWNDERIGFIERKEPIYSKDYVSD